jgi:thiol-disulfide isomerase/thioredoxin
VLFSILPIVGLILAVIIGAGQSASVSSGVGQPPAVTYIPFTLINNPAPEFALPLLRLTQGSDGQAGGQPESQPDVKADIKAYRGRWVFLNFWATWCPPCVAEMPELQKLYDGGFGNDPAQITVLTVNKGEDADTVRGFMEKFDLSLPVAMDSQSLVSGQYVVAQLPITVLIDPEGVVRYQHIGALDATLIPLYLERIRDRTQATPTP